MRKKIDINLEERWLDRGWKIFKIYKKERKRNCTDLRLRDKRRKQEAG